MFGMRAYWPALLVYHYSLSYSPTPPEIVLTSSSVQRLNSSWCSNHHRAISMRRVNHTPPSANAYSMNSRSPDVRPACPAKRGCNPIDIILGYPPAPSRHSSSNPRLHVSKKSVGLL